MNKMPLSPVPKLLWASYYDDTSSVRCTCEEKFEMNVFCTRVKSKEDEWEVPTKWLGKRGAFGSMAEVCAKGATDCDHVMKIMIIDDTRKGNKLPRGHVCLNCGEELGTQSTVTRSQFENEVELQKEAAGILDQEGIAIAPPVCDSWYCPPGEDKDKDPSFGVIIMPILQKTLKDIFLDANVDKVKKKAYNKEAQFILKKLNENNIQHRDSHLANFMIDANNKVKIIDFGQARKIEPCNFKSEDISEWSIPSASSPHTWFYEFFLELNTIQKTRELSGSVRHAMVQAAAEKHLKLHNERFRGIHSPIKTSHEFIMNACEKYKEEFYTEDKLTLMVGNPYYNI